jgi:hypothetical protein
MHFAPWYRREEYALIREIMEDGKDTFPLVGDFTRADAETSPRTAGRWSNRLQAAFSLAA